MIVVEGANRTGKSTLCRSLSELLHAKIRHGVGPPRTVLEIVEAHEAEYLCYGDILDRSMVISELVYAKFRQPLLDEPVLWKMIEDYLDPRWVLFYCTAVFKSQHDDESKWYNSKAHLKMIRDERAKIFERYELVIERCESIGLVVIRVTSPVEDKLTKETELWTG